MMVQEWAGIPPRPRTPDPGAAEVTVREATASNSDAALAMLTRCSRATLVRRFHGFTDGVAYTRALLRDQPNGDTLVAWNGSSCVALATLGIDATGIADLGVLVEDAWQRRGVGTRLITSLLDGARAKGVTTVHADVLGDDKFILRTLGRIAPISVSVARGTLSVEIDLGNAGR
jgi:N-acetylglutamate synthase-like GNAT family acetyltransferase